RGHRENLQFLFRELLYNALKYHREGTVPHIRIWVSSDQAARLWLVHVRDEGIGIEPAYQKRIFQVFERLHSTRAYAGTGIGLAICRRIMLAYGGNISVESEAGAYSTFTLAFPMQAQKMD
ncbi:MAG TPA: ATP-binding protein, partial [Saprospiraceae bacterium]|nr:ATP-binding protein [Saprospiraceae bacterium]